jgi:VanZ family protein
MAFRYRALWLGLGWFWVALVFYLCLMPSPPTPLHFAHADKLEHLFTYTLLMGWFGQLYPSARGRGICALTFVLMGVTIELLQGLGGSRQAEMGDMLANSSGVALGWLLLRTPLSSSLSAVEQRLPH